MLYCILDKYVSYYEISIVNLSKVKKCLHTSYLFDKNLNEKETIRFQFRCDAHVPQEKGFLKIKSILSGDNVVVDYKGGDLEFLVVLRILTFF